MAGQATLDLRPGVFIPGFVAWNLGHLSHLLGQNITLFEAEVLDHGRTTGWTTGQFFGPRPDHGPETRRWAIMLQEVLRSVRNPRMPVVQDLGRGQIRGHEIVRHYPLEIARWSRWSQIHNSLLEVWRLKRQSECW